MAVSRDCLFGPTASCDAYCEWSVVNIGAPACGWYTISCEKVKTIYEYSTCTVSSSVSFALAVRCVLQLVPCLSQLTDRVIFCSSEQVIYIICVCAVPTKSMFYSSCDYTSITDFSRNARRWYYLVVYLSIIQYKAKRQIWKNNKFSPFLQWWIVT